MTAVTPMRATLPALLLAVSAAWARSPPVRVAGEPVPDPHRWLEQVEAPEVVAWWTPRDAQARAWTAASGLEDALYRWVAAWPPPGDVPAERLLAEAAGVQLWVRLVREDPPAHPESDTDRAAGWRTTLEIRSPTGRATLGAPGVSPEAALCAWSLHAGAQAVAWGRALQPEAPERCWLHVTDLGSGRTTPVFVGERVAVSFSPDASRLLVRHVQGRQTHLEELTREGERLGERLRSPATLTAHWLESGHVAVLSGGPARGAPTDTPTLARVAWGAPDRLRWLNLPAAHYQLVGTVGDDLILCTDHEAPGMRVVRVNPERPHPRGWVELVPEDPGARLSSALLAGQRLLMVRDRDGLYTLKMQALGSSGQPEGPERSLDLSATEHMRLAPAGDHTLLHLRSAEGGGVWRLGPGAPPEVEQRPTQRGLRSTVLVRSADGAEVPVTVLRPLDARPDAPVWLEIYGGFGEIPRLSWNPTVALWTQRGGIYAVVHARGGGERGEAWHAAGRGENRLRPVEDLIAAAQHFAARGTPARRIFVHGTSHGGLVAVAAVARRPEVFGAVLAEVGVYDLLRGPRMGRWWSQEYGLPRRGSEVHTGLRGLSPVHTTPAGPLPPVMLVTGREDAVVPPAHSLKLAAAWENLPGGPVLLRVEPWISHTPAAGPGPDLEEALRAWAAYMAFVFRALELDTVEVSE